MPTEMFCEAMDTSIPQSTQIDHYGGRQPSAEGESVLGLGGNENVFPRKETQQPSALNRISKELRRSELQATERNARCAFFCPEINTSKLLSENVKDEQEMPSIRLHEHLLNITRLLSCKGFEEFRVMTKKDPRKKRGMWYKEWALKRTMLYVLKETAYYKNRKCLFRPEKSFGFRNERKGRDVPEYVTSSRRGMS